MPRYSNEGEGDGVERGRGRKWEGEARKGDL